MSFERALHFRTTPFASVGDILKALDEENLLQFGQVSVVGTTGYARLTLMTLPFARQKVGASKNAHPALGACQSEKLELESGSVALRQRLDHQILCAYYLQESRRKLRQSPDGRLAESRFSSKVTAPSPLRPRALPPGAGNRPATFLRG